MIQNHVCAYNTECYICMFASVDTEGMERLSTEKTDIWHELSNNHETPMAQEMFEGFVCRFYLALFHQFIEDGHWMIEPTKYNLYIYMYPPAMQWKNHEKPPLRDDFLIQTSILSRDFIDFLPSLINRRTFFYTPGTSQWSLGMFAVPTGLRPCKAKDCNSAKSLKLDLGWFVARLSLKMKSWHVMSKW